MTTPTTQPPDDLLGATTPLPRAAAAGTDSMSPPPMPKAPVAIETRGLSLRTKIFLAVAGTVLLVLIGTLAVGGRTSQASAQKSLDASLSQTAALISELIAADEHNLADKGRIFFSNPDIRSVIEKTGVDDSAPQPVVAPRKGVVVPKREPIDSGDFLDIAKTMVEETGASWVQITDRNGIRLARSDQQGAPAVDLSGTQLIARALNGDIVHGFGVASDSILFDAVSIPIQGAGTTVGVAMLVRILGDSTARQIKKLTGSDIVFFALDSADNIHIAGATGYLTDREHTEAKLTELITAEFHRVDSLNQISDHSMGSMLKSLQMDTTGSSMARSDKVDDHTYVWTLKPLNTAAQTVKGGVVALRDRDIALEPFTAVQKSVLIAGAAALLLAFGISFGVARQITQPVRGLVMAARRAAEGDYAAEIPPAKGEIGTLASAFNLLLLDLREKGALVDFLQGPTGGRTQIAQQQRMSMGGTGTAPRGMGGGMMLAAGETLANRYEIKKVLGAGGMGMVYKALDKELGETVAIKTLRPEFMEADPNALDRFRSEIRLARRISHRNVVRTHDIGEVNGLYYITMEFVEGSSLKDLIVSRGRLPAAAVVSIGKQLCRALEVAHEAGVIHRDIKPQNMVVEADGTVKVMDFGIARLQTRSDGHTQAGMVVGTPEYMSPEQLRGDELDGRSDLYSAGCVLYESLTGRVPLTADTPATLIGKVLTEVPAPPRASVAEVSPLLSSAIMQALEKDREKRPRTALEFLGILDRA